MYAILKEAQTSPLSRAQIEIFPSDRTDYKGLAGFLDTEIIALDCETRGTQAADPSFMIVGIGLSGTESGHTIYFDTQTLPKDDMNAFLDWAQGRQFIGHNIFFDACAVLSQYGLWLDWVGCTYGLTRLLASEGFFGQRWGLKDAQVNLLGWNTKGDVELDEWLIRNGYTTVNTDKKTEDQRAGNDKLRAKKAEMWRAPKEILGFYCGLDAYSTALLYSKVIKASVEKLEPAIQKNVWDYHRDLFIPNCKLLIDQQLKGVQIDTSLIEPLKEQLIAKEKFYFQELANSELRPFLLQLAEKKVQEHLEKEPNRYKKLPELGKEPPRDSKTWVKWAEKRDRILALGPGETAINWTKWNEKLKQAREAGPEGVFKPGSGQQRRWLLYECLGKPVKLTTDKGNPSVGKKALPSMGPIGRLFMNYDKQSKLHSFLESLEGIMIDGVWHPQFKVPGTLTGRLGGSGGFNAQNLPKSKKFLDMFKARPGHVWVDLDMESLEMVVLAELSRDESLLKLYAPDRPKNDVYLFNGANMPIIGPKIRATGYDPDNPTRETIEAAKKECKNERQISKAVTLAAGYMAGPGKIQEILALGGVVVSFEDAKVMHKGYWELYKGVKDYEQYLVEWWERNNGWVLNGYGRPICCADEKRKDLVNSVCLAGDTLVITDSGIKTLVSVALSDKLWDGEEWVSHTGVVHNGSKEVIQLNGITLTKDHEVLTKHGWEQAGNISNKQNIKSPSVGWKEVWGLCRHLGKCISEKFQVIFAR